MGQKAKKKYFLPSTSVSVSTLWEPHIVGALVRASKKGMKNYLMRPEGHCHDQNTTEKRTSQETGSIGCGEPEDGKLSPTALNGRPGPPPDRP